MAKYTIGVDFGSLSARSVLLSLEDGSVLNSFTKDYPHAVIEHELPNSDVELKEDWALQDPQDYLDSLIDVVSRSVTDAKKTINIDDIIAISVDFTSCTVLPVKADGTPLSFIDEFRLEPHAWVKLWKHHAAQNHANKLNKIAIDRKEPWLKFYGGKISSEWLFPKLMQIADEAPHIYKAMDRFIEAGDWITWQMTGSEMRSMANAGYKAMWDAENGFPENDFFKSLHPLLDDVIKDKIGTAFYPVGHKAGNLTQFFVDKFCLNHTIDVAIGNIDAHVSVASTKVLKPRTMLNIMGTSTCDIVLGESKEFVEGICGVVYNGAVPNLYAYESGQNAVGDIFGWFVKYHVPETYYDQAHKLGISIHDHLENLASALKPGASGLIALDWHNGNRSILVDTDLSGLILGLTLSTKPEEIYRALIEATAFGKRIIIEEFQKSGVPIEQLTVCGGLPHKNNLLNQIYADITGLNITVSDHIQTPAIGSALFAAVAAGSNRGGFDSIIDASESLVKDEKNIIQPTPHHKKVYDKLYDEYRLLHDYFGTGGNDVMKRIKAISKGENLYE